MLRNLVGLLILWGGMATSAYGFSVKKVEVDIDASPEAERMSVRSQLFLEGVTPGIHATLGFTAPAKIFRFIDAGSGEPVKYQLKPIPGVPETVGIKLLELELPEGTPSNVSFLIEYEYDRKSFSGFVLNPATEDNLYLGQLSKESIFSSHLHYYPSPGEGVGSASLRIKVPLGWMAVSSGNLVSAGSEGTRGTFLYESKEASGRLPFPLALYPYEKLSVKYAGRLPVSVYFAQKDHAFAKERLELIQTKILPFLERLMGKFPFPELRVIEVFPREGNTGLAAKGAIMLSERIWFAVPIGGDLLSTKSTVLVDEIAHQWNAYKVPFVNFLAEGISQYTDALFIEHVGGPEPFRKELDHYKVLYDEKVGLLKCIKVLRDKGMEIDEVAKELKKPKAEIEPLWPFSAFEELPISDPRVFPALYFLKGALALHALRRDLGDETFFKGFKALFSNPPASDEVGLDYFKSVFEKVSGRDLSDFIKKWYFTAGSPI